MGKHSVEWHSKGIYIPFSSNLYRTVYGRGNEKFVPFVESYLMRLIPGNSIEWDIHSQPQPPAHRLGCKQILGVKGH